MEGVYNRLLHARDEKTEWVDWHARTQNDVTAVKHDQKEPIELADPTNLRFYDWTSQTILKHTSLNPDSIILELGCGSGALSRQLIKKTGTRAILLDNEDVAIEYAELVCKDVRDNAEIVLGDAFHLIWPDETFDLVHSTGLIEHFSEESIDKLIGEHVRVLKKGGYAYILVPNFYGPYILNLWRKFRKNTERYITPGRLAYYFRNYDVSVIEKGATTFALHDKNPLSKFSSLEKFIGNRLGMGFLNYIIVKKNG